MAIAGIITNEEKVKLTISPVTLGGNPAQVEEGSFAFETVEGDATFEDIEGEPNSKYIISGEADVVSRIRVSADADLGPGVSTIEDEVILTVVPAGASSLGLGLGTPELK